MVDCFFLQLCVNVELMVGPFGEMALAQTFQRLQWVILEALISSSITSNFNMPTSQNNQLCWYVSGHTLPDNSTICLWWKMVPWLFGWIALMEQNSLAKCGTNKEHF
jgi:hypothetical protein